MTGCLRPTPTDNLPIFAANQPAELRRQGATLSLAYRSVMDLKHLFHQLIVGPTTAHKERLRFRHPFVLASRKLLNELSKLTIGVAQGLTVNEM